MEDHEVEFVDDPPSNYDYNCPVCLEMFTKDMCICQTTCCGHHMCSECITRLKNMPNASCPQCRDKKFDAVPDKFFTRQVLNLKVRCYYVKAGCTWTGELSHLNEHVEKNCMKGLVKCHLCDELCNIDEHLPVCLKAIFNCPNRCRNLIQKREAIKIHLENECSLRVVMPPKGTIPIAADGIVRVAPLSFTMTDYLKHLESGQPWYSPPFYTHERGYKLNIRVDANLRKENNLSVLACVIKGEHDHQLQWPLHAEVEISLLNWRGNGNNITQSLYLPGDEYCKQKKGDKIALWGNGKKSFAPNKELQFNPSKKTQYLSFDSLSFRIERVDILPAPTYTPELPIWAKRNSVSYFLLHSFERSKAKGSTSFSGPSFYTGKNGYQLQTMIFPNGYDKEVGKCVSVYARLRKTDHDNDLIWPFNGELKIELVNWREDNNHKSCIIRFNESIPEAATSKFIPGSNVAELSWGYSSFIEHSQLTYNSSNNTKYLHNDCLLFKVVFAVAYSTPCCKKIPFWRQRTPRSDTLLEFTLNKFSTRKSYKNWYYSRPIIASGYKMQILVQANGNGYIGVYVCLMKGLNDDDLIWPFGG